MPLPEKPPAVGQPEMWEPTTQPHTLCLAPLPHHLPNAIGPRPCQTQGQRFKLMCVQGRAGRTVAWQGPRH